MALRANRFFEVGGFDTTWRLASGEDRDLCDRLDTLGDTLLFAEEVTVRHFHRVSFVRFVRQHFRYGRSAIRFRKRSAARRRSRFRLESPAFYARLVLYPFGRTSVFGSLVQMPLMIVSQVAVAVGAVWQAISAEPAARSNDEPLAVEPNPTLVSRDQGKSPR